MSEVSEEFDELTEDEYYEVYNMLIFMKADLLEETNPELKKNINLAIECIETAYDIHPNYGVDDSDEEEGEVEDEEEDLSECQVQDISDPGPIARPSSAPDSVYEEPADYDRYRKVSVRRSSSDMSLHPKSNYFLEDKEVKKSCDKPSGGTCYFHKLATPKVINTTDVGDDPDLCTAKGNELRNGQKYEDEEEDLSECKGQDISDPDPIARPSSAPDSVYEEPADYDLYRKVSVRRSSSDMSLHPKSNYFLEDKEVKKSCDKPSGGTCYFHKLATPKVSNTTDVGDDPDLCNAKANELRNGQKYEDEEEDLSECQGQDISDPDPIARPSSAPDSVYEEPADYVRYRKVSVRRSSSDMSLHPKSNYFLEDKEAKKNHDKPSGGTCYFHELATPKVSNTTDVGDDPDLCNAKGNELRNGQKYEEALAYYTKAMILNPNEPLYVYNRALAYMGMEVYILCVKDCKEAIRKDSKYCKAYITLSEAYLQMGDFRKAERECKKPLNLEPDNDEYKQNLSLIQEKMKEEF